MPANVWYKEVEQGLQNEIINTTKYLSNDGSVVFLTPERVFVKYPEDDLREELFPCITLTQLSGKFNPLRYNPNPIALTKNVANKTSQMQKCAVAFDLIYQLDFWARYREDINIMTSTWLTNHFRQFNLNVIDDGGHARSVNAYVNESLKEANLVKNQKRLFHSVISYVIWVELDDEIGYNTNIVTERIIHHSTKGE